MSRQNHGQVCYLQIPAQSIERSAGFYEAVFGWMVERPHPSFEAPGMIGQWVTDRQPAGEGGVIFWILVEDIEATLRDAQDAGAQILKTAYPDGGERLLGVIRDPAGNEVGVAQLVAP